MSMKAIEYILNNQLELLEFLRTRFPMYHLSNFFFRDVQYGLKAMLEEKGMRVRYGDAEEAARAYVEKLEQAKIFRPIDHQSWMVNYPAFKTPVTKAAAPAKPASVAPAAPRITAPAGSTPAAEAHPPSAPAASQGAAGS